MESKRFYRICNDRTRQGLWYDFKGNFTGLIHNEFNFCSNSGLPMEFDEEVIGYLSATNTLEELFQWFTLQDIIKLQEYGWFLCIFETADYKFYDKFQHMLISKEDSWVVAQLTLTL